MPINNQKIQREASDALVALDKVIAEFEEQAKSRGIGVAPLRPEDVVATLKPIRETFSDVIDKLY